MTWLKKKRSVKKARLEGAFFPAVTTIGREQALMSDDQSCLERREERDAPSISLFQVGEMGGRRRTKKVGGGTFGRRRMRGGGEGEERGGIISVSSYRWMWRHWSLFTKHNDADGEKKGKGGAHLHCFPP